MTHEQTDIQRKLTSAGLRPTRQRLLISEWLFSGGDKHFTAEDIHLSFQQGGVVVSLATIYNTLGVFSEAGLLSNVSVEGDRLYYDTNTKPHYHFYDEDRRELSDFDSEEIGLVNLPSLPAGKKVKRIDVIIRTTSA